MATEIVSKMQNSVNEFGQPLFNSNEVLEVSQIETLLSSFMQAQKKKLKKEGNNFKRVALTPEDRNDNAIIGNDFFINLNNYFNFQVCLSAHPFVHLFVCSFVRPKISSNFSSC